MTPRPISSEAPAAVPAPAQLLRALQAVARHEAARASFHAAVLRQQALAERHRSVLAEHEELRRAREATRAATRQAWLEREADREDREALHREVTEFVRRLKAAGMPPQSVLVTVKSLVADVALAQDPPLYDSVPLTDEVVRWSLDAYYPAA
jgi:seryl-tRNA synthetase